MADVETLQKIIREKEGLVEELKGKIAIKDALIESLQSSNALDAHLESPRLVHITKGRPHPNRKHQSWTPETSGLESNDGEEKTAPPSVRVTAMGGINVLMGLDLTAIKLRRPSKNKDESAADSATLANSADKLASPPMDNGNAKPSLTKDKPKAIDRQPQPSPAKSTSSSPGNDNLQPQPSPSKSTSGNDNLQSQPNKPAINAATKPTGTHSHNEGTGSTSQVTSDGAKPVPGKLRMEWQTGAVTNTSSKDDKNETTKDNSQATESPSRGAGKEPNNVKQLGRKGSRDSNQKQVAEKVISGDGDGEESHKIPDDIEIPRSRSSSFRRRRKNSSSSLSGNEQHKHNRKNNQVESSSSLAGSANNSPSLLSPTPNRTFNRRSFEKSGGSQVHSSEAPWKALQQQQQQQESHFPKSDSTTNAISTTKPVIVSGSDAKNSWRMSKQEKQSVGGSKPRADEIFKQPAAVESEKTESDKRENSDGLRKSPSASGPSKGSRKSWSNAVKGEDEAHTKPVAKTVEKQQETSASASSTKPISPAIANTTSSFTQSNNNQQEAAAIGDKRPGSTAPGNNSLANTANDPTRRLSTAKDWPSAAANAVQDDQKRPSTATSAIKQNNSEAEAITYIKQKTGESIQDLRKELLDGRVLCKLANSLRKDGEKIKINEGRFTASHMENLTNYLKFTEKMLGSKGMDMFKISDLVDGQNMTAVINHILAIKRQTTPSFGASFRPE